MAELVNLICGKMNDVALQHDAGRVVQAENDQILFAG